MQIKIVYEDKDILVIHKPAGIATQTAKSFQKDVISEITNYLSEKEGKVAYVGMVHRLDQPVEGLLVFGKNKAATAELSKQISADSKTCRKDYMAVVSKKNADQLDTKEGHTLVDYLKKDAKMAKAVICQKSDGQRAELVYCVADQIDEIALLNITIKTGRFHQIRAQLANEGMPILGDTKYGTPKSIELSQKHEVKTVALCANQLQFIHPRTKQQLCYKITPENVIFHKFLSE